VIDPSALQAERCVRSIREECLDRIVPIGECHFRRAVAEYVEHAIANAITKGLDNRLIASMSSTQTSGRVRRRQRLGGLLNFYERAA
jgi:hypothetical protein